MSQLAKEHMDRVACGDALAFLGTLPDESVDFCMTSPPYYGMRNYGVEGAYGLEETWQEYVERILDVTAELKRVLKKTGSFWLNLGDTYSGGKQAGQTDDLLWKLTVRQSIPGKCLMNLPHRIALRMCDEQGWLQRNDLIWYKPNHMPSSVLDRFTNSYENLFFFSKSPNYYFDLDAVREPQKFPEDVKRRIRQDHDDGISPFAKGQEGVRWRRDLPPENYHGKFEGSREVSEEYGSPRARSERRKLINLYDTKYEEIGNEASISAWRNKQRIESGNMSLDPSHPLGKNPGDCWQINTRPFKDAHFAVYPEELCSRPIKAGCPQDGVVLDPFAGSGTTLVVAKKLRRHYLGCDINPAYVKMARERLALIPPSLLQVATSASIQPASSSADLVKPIITANEVPNIKDIFTVEESADRVFRCSLCNKPVDLKDTKADFVFCNECGSL